ncbi:MAG: transcriptional activator NhaR [Aquabacterium sp.]|nr:MAG: transcriptional activator NhaR [Aquabacterium sp.]
MAEINYKHLHYFWVVAKAGGIARAGEQLHLTPQTISSQIQLLEEQLRTPLLRKQGRRLELTEAGRRALRYADEIFALGSELKQAMREHPKGAARIEFRVGITDAVPKSIAYSLLEPALEVGEPVRVICRESALTPLLGELAVHRLDLVIADVPLPQGTSIKAFNHALGRSGVSFFAAPKLKANIKGRFPACLEGQPMLMPSSDSALRPRLERWLEQQGVRPLVVGEFEDGALMNAFGREGRGVFIAPGVIEREIQSQYGVRKLGSTDALSEEFFAITIERRVTHPCVAALMAAARERLRAAPATTDVQGE